MNWQEELNLAITIAHEVGSRLKEIYVQGSSVIYSSERDVKLQADVFSEELIIRRLREQNNYPIISEECGLVGLLDSNTPVWIIDPLDGTVNYSRKIPCCSISIALWCHNLPQIGVIYDFINGNLYSGITGRGAWCNGETIGVSGISRKQEGVLVTGFPAARDFSSVSLQGFIQNVKDFRKIRMFGCASLSLAAVAAGKADAYVEDSIRIWDVAAGIALVEAAGGWVAWGKLNNNWSLDVICSSCKQIWYPEG